MRIMGVDPGLSGAIAVIDVEAGAVVGLADMPRGERGVDPYAVGAFIDVWAAEIRLCVIEDVGVMGGHEGVVSMFNFGRSTGVIHGALGVCNVPVFYARPAVWKQAMGLTSEKRDSLRLAAKLFPEHADAFKRVKDDGRAEAVLLAVYGSRIVGKQ